MKAHEKLQAYWAQVGAEFPVAPARAADLVEFEARYSLKLPGDFREYLLACAPAAENWEDHRLTNWWPLRRMQRLPDEYRHELGNPAVAAEPASYLVFADGYIWCWAWAINCRPGGRFGWVAVIGTPGDRFVASSFSEFVDKFIMEDDRVIS